MPLHEDQTAANRHALNSFNTGAKLAGGDTAMDAIILPLTTVAGLKVAIAALNVHEDQKYALTRINKAVDASAALGVYGDAAIAAADTTAGVRALHTTAVVPNIPAVDATQQGSVLWGE
jgi:hypothetical protein